MNPFVHRALEEGEERVVKGVRVRLCVHEREIPSKPAFSFGLAFFKFVGVYRVRIFQAAESRLEAKVREIWFEVRLPLTMYSERSC